MSKGSHLGELEHLVLLALVRLGQKEPRYGMTVRREIEDSSRRRVSIGSVYATLERLEKKGHVRSWHGDPSPVRGGRRRRFFEPTASGLTALEQSRACLDRMWKGVSIRPGKA